MVLSTEALALAPYRLSNVDGFVRSVAAVPVCLPSLFLAEQFEILAALALASVASQRPSVWPFTGRLHSPQNLQWCPYEMTADQQTAVDNLGFISVVLDPRLITFALVGRLARPPAVKM